MRLIEEIVESLKKYDVPEACLEEVSGIYHSRVSAAATSYLSEGKSEGEIKMLQKLSWQAVPQLIRDTVGERTDGDKKIVMVEFINNQN